MDKIAPSHYQPNPVISLGELKPECTLRLKHVIGKILALQSTKLAIAQIKDNKAIQGHFHLRHSTSDRHQPNVELRSAPSPDAVEFARNYCERVDIVDVKIDAQAADAFQVEVQERPGSYASALRLLEVVSMIVHELMGTLHRDLHSAPNEPLDPEDSGLRGIEHMSYPRLHYLRNNRDSAVAYWAETEIFGGPIVFDRGNPVNPECRAAYIQEALSDEVRNNVLVQLTEEQVMSFMAAAAAPMASVSAAEVEKGIHGTEAQPPLESILPFKSTKGARRMDPLTAIHEEIYRERGQISNQWGNVTGGQSCVV